MKIEKKQTLFQHVSNDYAYSQLYNQYIKKSIQSDSYFRPIFNIMYYLLLVPFYVQSQDGKYFLYKNRLQITGCILIHTGTIVGSTHFIYFSNIQSLFTKISISRLLEIVGYLSSFVSITALLHVFWKRQHSLLRFMERSRVRPVPEWVIISWIVLYLMQIGSYQLPGGIPEMADEMSGSIISNADNLIFIKLLRIPLTVLIWMLLTQGTVLVLVSRFLVMLLSVQTKELGVQFERFLKLEGSVRVVSMKLDILKETLDVGRKWSNELVIFNYVPLLAFLARLPEVIRNQSEPKLKLEVSVIENWWISFMYGSYGVFLVIACDVPQRLRDSCKRWISQKRYEKITNEENFLLLSLAHDIDNDPIGLSCSFFTLTYNFIGSMLGLVATYGILVFQTQT